MKQIYQEFKWFLQQKIYVLALAFTAICSYGFEIVTPIIGIDDTAVELYLQDGLEVVMGRWTLFLLNKVFHIAEFAPFLLELVGVVFLCMGATLFAVLMKRGLEDTKVNVIAYTIFSCIFVSNPIMSEVFIYYYHNGSGLAYILIGLALLIFQETLQKDKVFCKSNIIKYILSMLLLWVAVGCYESFIILYILGIIVVLFLYGWKHPKQLKFLLIAKKLLIAAVLTVGCVLLRSVAIMALTEIFDLHAVEGLKNQRSLLEMSVLFADGGLDTLWMLIKRFYVVYYVNAVCYMPVTGYVFAVFVLGILSVIQLVQKKNVWFPVLFLGMLFAPFLLTLAEASVTLYRSCQYLPFFVAFGAFLFYEMVSKLVNGDGQKYGKYVTGVLVIAAMAWIFNQATAMNKNFYVDYLKYEHTKDVLGDVADEVERHYGNETPIVFVGHYDVPQEFMKDYYVGYGSKEYQWVVRLTDPIDPHLKEKYFTPYGYCFVGEAANPFIQWGLDAFDGTNKQMIRFMEMHGHEFGTITDSEILEEAKEIGDTMPRWPMEGSITEQNGYILIHM